jgi:SAM-dependent methyltransferase
MTGFIKSLIHSLVVKAILFTRLRGLVNGGTFHDLVVEHAGLTGHESVLDVGCGAGEYSVMTDGQYLGLDGNADYIRHATRVYGTPRREFRQGDLTQVTFKEPYDIGLYISMLHHFDDKDNERILGQLARVVKRVIVVDPLDGPNPFRHFLVSMDRGGFIRTREQQEALLGRMFRIERKSSFLTRSGSAELALYVCVPK